MHGGCIGMIIPVDVHADSPLIMARIWKAMTGKIKVALHPEIRSRRDALIGFLIK